MSRAFWRTPPAVRRSWPTRWLESHPRQQVGSNCPELCSSGLMRTDQRSGSVQTRYSAAKLRGLTDSQGKTTAMWNRFRRAMRSFAGFFVSSIEDPELILEQNIRDLNDQVPRMNESIAMVRANLTLLEKENIKYK